MTDHGTYVYCLVAAARRPGMRKPATGPAGTGPVRLLPVARGQWLAVADAPLGVFGARSINDKLGDLEWVSRAAVAHEAVVEGFVAKAIAVLPMKLFTIFTSDERALEHIRQRRRQVDVVLERVKHHHEWGLRVVLDRTRRSAASPGGKRRRDSETSGTAYLSRKKQQRDAASELAARAREVANDLYDRVTQLATTARRRYAGELPVTGGPLLLDAALLVPRARTTRVQKAIAREAKQLATQGYSVTLTGPWPPYSFLQE